MANEMTIKLADSIKKAKSNMQGRAFSCELERNFFFAEQLIESGVIVPPCKVGDTVYELKENRTIVKGIVESIHQNLVGNEQGRWIVTSWFDDYYADSKKAGFECGTHLYSPFDDFGKTVFLTEAEAEEALKARANNVKSD